MPIRAQLYYSPPIGPTEFCILAALYQREDEQYAHGASFVLQLSDDKARLQGMAERLERQADMVIPPLLLDAMYTFFETHRQCGKKFIHQLGCVISTS